jgi:hypothetical protein
MRGREAELRADHEWLKARGWVPMPWRTRPYERRYGGPEYEYTEREWRRGREVIFEAAFGHWQSADKERGCSWVEGLFAKAERGGQLSLELE